MLNTSFRSVSPAFSTEERTRRYYHWHAQGYDRATGHGFEHHREAVELAAVRPGVHGLEVATGTGRATIELAARLDRESPMQALDLSDAMLAQAQRKLAEQGLLHRVHLRIRTALDLPYTDGSFDVVNNAHMFDLVAAAQVNPLLLQFRRVLKSGRRLVVVNMSKAAPGATLYGRVYRLTHLSSCRPVAIERHARGRLPRCPTRLPPEHFAFDDPALRHGDRDGPQARRGMRCPTP